MTPSLSDDQIDALVRRERLDPPRTTKSWRDTQRAELLAYVDGPGEEPPAASGRAEWTPRPAAGSSLRRWGWVAAGFTVVAGVAALVVVADRDGGRPVASDVSVPSESVVAEPVPSPVAKMEAPGIAVSPEVTRLLALPACESTDGLAKWTADQLGWWNDLDPTSAQPAEFGAVTALVAVDTAAMSATCSSAVSMDGVLAWGLGDGSGNWVARAAGVPEAIEYDSPAAERDIDMDGQFGTGQFFNDFGVGDTDVAAVASGALSPADSVAPSPIYVIEFASDVDLDVVSSRLWYLRTTTATLDENVTGSPNPALVPALVPQGFGRCTVEYARLNSQSIDALAVDYCNTTSTITVTAGKIVDGEPFSIAGIDVLIERDGDTVSVGFAVEGPIVIGPAVVPDDQLTAMLLSIRVNETDGGQPANET